jgi:hypothetical protein
MYNIINSMAMENDTTAISALVPMSEYCVGLALVVRPRIEIG